MKKERGGKRINFAVVFPPDVCALPRRARLAPEHSQVPSLVSRHTYTIVSYIKQPQCRLRRRRHPLQSLLLQVWIRHSNMHAMLIDMS